MKTLAASLSILTQQGVMLYLLRGVAFTCIISVLGVILGLIVGSLLALARTYCKHGPARVLGWLSAAYIELFRNTPYLLWIFVCVVFCPCPAFFARKMFGLTSVEMKLLFKAALALILFNSSVIAEIVRGGLNVGDLFNAGFGSNGMNGGEIFNAFIGNPTEAIIYGLIFVALTMIIVMGGIGGGIEKVCSIGMPALFVALLICIIRACTLENAVDGLKYMFIPGWAVANGVIEKAPSFFEVLSTAGGQMFFSLSLGMGAMITYGSYLDKKENLEKNAILIVVMDTLVALMAGLCVIPGRFALDPEGALGGPSLLFVTMQNVFSRMGPIGPLFGILFYLLVVFAAVSSSISLLEVIVAHFVDKARDAGKGDKRKAYTLIAAAAVGLGCILVCADQLGGASFTPWKLLNLPETSIRMWNDCWLDFFDMLSEGVMMPFGALLMSLMIGWEVGPDMVKDECEQSGHAMGGYGFFKVCVKYITPLCMILILYGQLTDFFG